MNVPKNLQLAGFAWYLTALKRTSRISVTRATPESVLATFTRDAMLALLAATLGTDNVAIYIRAQPLIEDTLELLAKLRVPAFVSDHRGTAGVKAARHWLRTPGRVLAVSADPLVPQVVVPGVARLARMLHVPLCPLVVTVSHGYRVQRKDRCVVPHLAGELTVCMLPPVSEPSLDASAAAIGRALSKSTLHEPTHTPAVPWRRALEVWPRLCMRPRTNGQIKVWPATEPVEISF
ncbi:MAG TPA: hypothetical protein VER96_03210 [Polyangiaceae bacterium]|nr:hypothetical protein [Polyangiaceae bacterium]